MQTVTMQMESGSWEDTNDTQDRTCCSESWVGDCERCLQTLVPNVAFVTKLHTVIGMPQSLCDFVPSSFIPAMLARVYAKEEGCC